MPKVIPIVIPRNVAMAAYMSLTIKYSEMLNTAANGAMRTSAADLLFNHDVRVVNITYVKPMVTHNSKIAPIRPKATNMGINPSDLVNISNIIIRV